MLLSYLLPFAFVALAVGSIADFPVNANLFLEWTSVHGRDYSSHEELEERFAIFQQNQNLINQHNAEVKMGLHTFTMAINKFADLTHDEFRSNMLGKARSPSMTQPLETFRATGIPPGEWDWRPTGIVTDVKDQAQCGSCWAFSAVAAMEGAFNRKNNGSIPKLCTASCGPDSVSCCSFSEQEIVDCTLKGTCTCDLGGEMHDGFLEIINNHKGVINTEQQYPYTSGGGTSKGVCRSKDTGVATGFTGYANVTHGNEDALAAASYEKTIISVGIDASQNSFQFYSQGVYNEPECKNSQDDLDHGVAVVGYGTYSGPSPTPGPPGPPAPGPADCVDNNSKETCSAEAGCHWCQALGAGFCFSFPCGSHEAALHMIPALNNTTGIDYWLVKNSWGAGWGQDGYILMSRNSNNQCGIVSDAQYPL